MCWFARLASVSSATEVLRSREPWRRGGAASSITHRADAAVVHIAAYEVLHVEDADDVVVSRLCGRRRRGHALMGESAWHGEGVIGRQFDRERYHLERGTMTSEASLLAKIEHLGEHLSPRRARSTPARRRAREQHVEITGLGVGLVVGAGRLLAEQPEHELGRLLQEPDQGREGDEGATSSGVESAVILRSGSCLRTPDRDALGTSRRSLRAGR